MRTRSLPRGTRWLLLSILLHLGLLLPLFWWRFEPPTTEEPVWQPRAELRVISISTGSSAPVPNTVEIHAEPKEIPPPDRDLSAEVKTVSPASVGPPVIGSPGVSHGERRTAPVPLSLSWVESSPGSMEERGQNPRYASSPILLRVYVTVDGSVSLVEAVDIRDMPFPDSTVVAAARALRFRPATSDGTPVPAWTTVEIRVSP